MVVQRKSSTRRSKTSHDSTRRNTRRSSCRRKRRGSVVDIYKVASNLRVLAIRLGLICVISLVCYFAYIYGVAPYTSKWQAFYGNEVYPEGYSIHGIDVSHHQGEIDWHKVKNAEVNGEPISFVFIKATEGQNHIDENYNDNFYQARDICDYRRLHGPIKSLHQLSLLKTFPPAQIERLEPYVSYE